MRRRDFLKGLPAAVAGVGLGVRTPGAGAAGTATGPGGGLRPAGPRSGGGPGAEMVGSVPAAVGVQLYTVRAALADHPEATLDALAAVGYEEVERAGLAGHTVAQFRGMLERTGLRAVSSHEGLDVVLDGPGIDQAAALGQEWIVVPSLDAGRRTPEGYRRTADDFDRAGEAARAAGLRFAFHNQPEEFERLPDGTTGYATLLARCDPELVSVQLDVFWAVHAGQDPLALFAAHPGRFTSLHVKDRTPAGAMVDVGRGAIDYAAVFAGADRAGVEHVFVEHDQPRDPLDSVRVSYDAVRRLLEAAR